MNAFLYKTASLIAADPRLAPLRPRSQPVRLKTLSDYHARTEWNPIDWCCQLNL
jgi:hypothetical protein